MTKLKQKSSSLIENVLFVIVCGPTFYGQDCMNDCSCHPKQAKNITCDPQTGQCKCKAGFKGRDCSDCKLFVKYFK